MSWEAVTWASKQRMKLPHEQLILLVLANCADPSGVAFAEWPGKEHWWKYLVDRTRLSKSSLFRHINTLVDLGLCARSTLILSDGTKRPTIRLDLDAAFDIDTHSHQWDQSHGKTESEEGSEEDAYACDINELEAENSDASGQSHGETGPTGGNGPFPIVGMHKDSNLDSKHPPLPPSGGMSASASLWEEFLKAWAEPIPKLALARQAFDHIETSKCGEAVAAAKGYFAWLRKHPKPPATVSAQAFLRDHAGWTQWLRYVPDTSGLVPNLANVFVIDSIEARAILILHEMVSLREFMLRVSRSADGGLVYRGNMNERLRAMAQAPAPDQWVTLTFQQSRAWERFLSDHITVNRIRRLSEGSRAPWPWPPSVDGKLYTSATGPPETLMTDQDEEDFANEKARG